jgi:exopolysaccharide biosynthesis polyprenyl glycosylphosphotransferase
VAVEAPDVAILRQDVVWQEARRRPWFSYPVTVKRMLDLFLASTILLMALPVMMLVALAIRLDSPGPVLYVQERIGLHGRRFRFYKFRSMGVDAERRRQEVAFLNEAQGPVFKIRNDPRLTRVGRWLRKTSLDELPQLINVIHGEMSLVGPRPPLPAEVEQYRSADAVRLMVKPGITCLWQVRGRSNCSFDQWMAYDREYVQRLSLSLDLSILLRTVWVVVSCQGAY